MSRSRARSAARPHSGGSPTMTTRAPASPTPSLTSRGLCRSRRRMASTPIPGDSAISVPTHSKRRPSVPTTRRRCGSSAGSPPRSSRFRARATISNWWAVAESISSPRRMRFSRHRSSTSKPARPIRVHRRWGTLITATPIGTRTRFTPTRLRAAPGRRRPRSAYSGRTGSCRALVSSLVACCRVSRTSTRVRC